MNCNNCSSGEKKTARREKHDPGARFSSISNISLNICEVYAFVFSFAFLFGAENPVAGIAQARADISVRIQLAVQMSHIDLDVRMRFL